VIDAMLEIVRRDAPWIYAYYPSLSAAHGWCITSNQPDGEQHA